jgi:hypothetical protein
MQRNKTAMRKAAEEWKLRSALRKMGANGMMFANDTPYALKLVRRGYAVRIRAPLWAINAGMGRGYKRLQITDKGREFLAGITTKAG